MSARNIVPCGYIPDISREELDQKWLKFAYIIYGWPLSECVQVNDEVIKTLAIECPLLKKVTLNWCWDIRDSGLYLFCF